MKSKMKYIVIVIMILGMIYAKSKIDANNDSRIEMIDNLEDGSSK